MSYKLRIAGILTTLTFAWWQSGAAATPTATEFAVYRFDDNLKAATAKAASARVGEPVIWENFSKEKIGTWIVRGSMRLRNGGLLLKGEGSLPLVQSPKEFPIDWKLYEAVRIRMVAEAGDEVRIKIGPDEFVQKLGPPGQYQVYWFEVNIQAPKGSRPLAIFPTNSLSGLVTIDYIELVPLRGYFHEAVGRQFVGKNDDYQNTLYAHTPASLTYNVRVLDRARLRFSIGVAERKAVVFKVRCEGTELFRRTLEDPSVWEDAEADLGRFAGRTIRLVFEASSTPDGNIALWANPRMTATGARSRPNILLYLVCTMRRDHMSLYGYARETTPFLKTLGSTGVVFEDAHAQAAWTKASVPSMMTSLSAYATGIVRDSDTIPSGATTLAEQLRSAGYITASFVTSPFAGKASGLERGFDYLAEHQLIQRMRSEKADRGTDSGALNKALARWLERHQDEPFFLYAHSSDPHAPYDPPAEFEVKFSNPTERAQFNRNYGLLRDRHMYGGGITIRRVDCLRKGIHPERFLGQAIERYDAEIAHSDSSVEQLAGTLKELGILDRTLIIVVSDHGEEFWEHGWTGHGHSLYQELTRVAWLMWNPKLLPSPKRVDEPVQLMDLVPTVLDLTNIRPSGMLQGQSLAPLLRGSSFERKMPVIASRFARAGAKPRGFVPESRTGTLALITRDWKLIWRNQALRAGLPAIELYDRRTDRAETRNVAAGHPDVVQRLKTEMDRWVDAQETVRKLVGPKGETSLSHEAFEQLRSLGYVGR